jgi:hypothetical protein
MGFDAPEDPRLSMLEPWYVGGDLELYGPRKAGITKIAATHFTTINFPGPELWC